MDIQHSSSSASPSLTHSTIYSVNRERQWRRHSPSATKLQIAFWFDLFPPSLRSFYHIKSGAHCDQSLINLKKQHREIESGAAAYLSLYHFVVAAKGCKLLGF